MKDRTNGQLDKELVFAKSIGDTTLQYCIDHIKLVDENNEFYTETELYNDSDPRSFYFIRRRKDNPEKISNGGIIFHDFKNGDSRKHVVINPDFSKASWQIHT